MFLSNRAQRVLVDISSCPKIFVGSPRDLVSLLFKVYMNLPGGVMRHHFILGYPKGWHPASETSSWTSPLRTSVLALPWSEICVQLILSWVRPLSLNGQDSVECSAWSACSYTPFVPVRAAAPSWTSVESLHRYARKQAPIHSFHLGVCP